MAGRPTLSTLLDTLYALEREEGVTDRHRVATSEVLAAWPHQLLHSRPHRNALTGLALSPDGRHLATVSMAPQDDWDEGGVLAVWELRCGRVVGSVPGVHGGAGWPDHPAGVQWTGDGRGVVAVFSTNGVGVFDPFDDHEGPWLEARVTDGSDHPPAFAASPDGQRLVVSWWGPDNPEVPGLVVEAHEEAEWVSEPSQAAASFRGDGPLPRWRRAVWPERGPLGIGRGLAWAVSDPDFELRWQRPVGDPAVFTPCGSWLAHDRGGLEIVDGRTGEPHAFHGELAGASLLVPARTGAPRFALGFGRPGLEEGAVIVVDGADVVAVLDVSLLLQRGSGDLPDAVPFAFSPDGRHGAVLGPGGHVSVWDLAEASCIQRFVVAPSIVGLLWGAHGVLVAAGPDRLELWDAHLGLWRQVHDLGPAPGFPDASPGYGGWHGSVPGLDPTFAVHDADTAQRRWVVATRDGQVCCEDADRRRLDGWLVWSLGAGVGWPLRWGEAPDCTDEAVAAAWARRSESLPPPDDAFDVFEVAREAGAQNRTERPRIEHARVPLHGVHHYAAPRRWVGGRITPELVHWLRGRAVLFAERGRPRFVFGGTVLHSDDTHLTYFCKSHGGHHSGGLRIADLLWIGVAVWVGDG